MKSLLGLRSGITYNLKNRSFFFCLFRAVYFWFYAKIKPTVFHNLYMDPDEAFLRDGCPVTCTSLDDHYEFFYYSYDCGIITKTFQNTFLLITKIKYISRNSEDRAEMPLSRVVTKRGGYVRVLSCEAESGDNETSSEDIASEMQPW
uniref:Uncharacterized protein n=1 Tax=Sus scrofa TaxID=9823 RepID=A0A8W4FEM1_PIG